MMEGENKVKIERIEEEIRSRIGEEEKLILSISGGVDSMVCSYILERLKIDYVCVHINYTNREENKLEEEYVVEWCKKIRKPIYIRRIEEIKRDKCMKNGLREIYEEYTREIRYNTYRQVSEMIGNKKCKVILGHNKDDCLENILTNITNKNKYENLSGMESESEIDGIKFMRPMIEIEKKEIYEVANMKKIYYLKDSTPKWSQRGRIRDKVRPTLEEWNKESIEGLFELKRVMEESNKLIDELIEIISGKIEIKDKNIKIELNKKNIIKNRIFWEKILKKYNIRYTVKSIEGYIERIKNIGEKYDKIHINHINSYQMNKNYIVKIIKRRDNKIEILFNFI
jgi:tRNA(Ile)-lysidine synthetase-like protein